MLEGKALVIAIMMLTAAPIAATDSGQIFIGDVRDNFEDMLANDEPTKVSEIIDDSKLDEKDLLTTEDSDVPCFTFEEWKEQFLPEDKEVVREEKDGARNGDGKETDDKKEEYYDREDWADKKTVSSSKYDGCLTVDEWTLKFESDEDKDEPCYTIADIEKKIEDERKSHKNFFGRDKEWDREEKDWDDEWFEELEILAEACKEGDEESCDELLEIREELAEDRDEEERDDDDSEDEASGDDEVTIIHDEGHDLNDEEKAELVAVIGELKEACEGGNEAACLELEELLEEYWKDWEQDKKRDWDREEKDWDGKACLTKEEWKEVFGDGKYRKEDHDSDDDRKERGSHRDAIVREMLAELEAACDEGNEEACEGLEVMLAELEEREGDCDKERDDDEDESGEDETDEDEPDDDESGEDESDDEDELNEE